MAAFKSIFGDELIGKTGDVATDVALSEKVGVLVYFSAHWCPPCRGFTPLLAEFYSKHAAAQKFEVVFVSSDRDLKAFKEYFGEQPWLALPFEKRDQKAALSKKYKVQGIPSLVVLGPEGEVITMDGRSKVMGNFEDCAGFPWKPPTLADALGEGFLRQDGSKVGMEAIAGKTLGLYFSAHWCPPCQTFTPKLKEFYEAYRTRDPNFEIIFVSSDQEESEMLSYFKNDHGNYLALPFENRQAKTDLSDIFNVEGIPTFVVCSADGQTLNANARGKVAQGAEVVLAVGWEPPAVGDMAEGPEAGGTNINECPTVVVMCESCDVAAQKSIHDALEPLAKHYIKEAKSKDSDPEYIFLLAKDGGPINQLKALTKKAIDNASGKPTMILCDIPDNGGFYIADTNNISTASVEAFLKSKGVRKQLSRPGEVGTRKGCCTLM
jgi:nucleoredoxin